MSPRRLPKDHPVTDANVDSGNCIQKPEHVDPSSTPANDAILSEYARKEQIAQLFGVSQRTIERWVRLRGLPKPIRLGRTLLFHIPTLKEHLAAQAQQQTSAHRRRR